MSHALTLDERTAQMPPSSGATVATPTATRRRGRLGRLFLGSQADPAWGRPALWGLLALSALVYLWNLTNSGYANDFYAAAVKSATKSWTAWLFGSLDSANSITVDKPPAAMWVMGLSARLFGFSSFSLLLPEALMGVGTVALVAAAVRRWYGHAAGLVAGALVLATPVAAMMFRFDNPDAMLTLLMAAAAYFVTRAIEVGGPAEPGGETANGRKALWWMVGAGSAIGFAFLTKMLQGMLVLPGFVLAYLLAAPRSWKARFGHLFAALASMIVSAGWFVLLADLWPSASRPYIGGSTNNSEWELALGYNGLGRLFGGSGNAGGMGGGGGGFGGTAGLFRMFNAQFAGEISWFLPAALLLLVAGLVACGRAPRTDRARAGLVVWGGWMLSTAVVLSFMQGTVHSYYAIALAPGIAATVAIGAVLVLRRAAAAGRLAVVWRTVLGLAISITAGWGYHLMKVDAPTWHSWIRWTALVLGLLGAMAYVALDSLANTVAMKKLAVGALLIGSLGAVAPSAAWTAATVAVGHTGSMPTAGPAAAAGSMGGMGGGQMGGTPPTGSTGTAPSGSTGTAPSGSTGTAPSGTAPSGTAPSGTSGSTGTAPSGSTGTAPSGTAPTGTSGSGSSSSSSAQRGGGMEGNSNNTALITALNKTSSKWSAAVIGDQSAAGLILNSNTAVMAIGGWGGSDNNVTLAQFKQYVANGDITYFIAGGGMGGGPQGGSSSSASEITSWVQANFKSTTIGGTTVYVLTSAK